MFEHSVRVPRHYKIAATIFKKVSTEGGSVKTLLYDDKLRHFRTNVLYALISETVKHASVIEKIFEDCEILVKEPRLDPWLAKVLAAELLFGKKALPGKSKPEQTINNYKEQFEKLSSENQDDLKPKGITRPRYVRINTNLLATSDAIRAFQDDGYKFIRCTSGSYDDYLKQIQSLTEYTFTQDYHVKTMFVFTPGTKFHESDLYLENKIILQDKATAMAVHLLAPPPGSVVLDMCAAPGMKTTQLAAYLRNQGKIYAVERNEGRFRTLCDFVEATGSTCVKTFNKDSLEIKRGDLDDVEYIILDPSCSGSGMEFSVHNYVDKTRLAKLTSLQEKFLKHAMNSFPNAKRIVYSTCSINPEENERVVTNIVKASRSKWRVQDVRELLKNQWNNFGSSMYGSMGTRCLYARPDSDYTTGFFLAVLDKDQKNPDNDQNKESEPTKNEINKCNKEKVDTKKMVKAVNESEIEEELNKESNIEDNVNSYNKDHESSKHKKKKKNKSTSDFSEGTEQKNDSEDTETKSKKHRKRNIDNTELILNHDIKTNHGLQINNEIVEMEYDKNDIDQNQESPKRKKKKKKEKMLDSNECMESINTSESDAFKKKKKQKIRDIDEEDQINLVPNDNLNVVSDDHDMTKHKKKKKKDKTKDCEDTEISPSNEKTDETKRNITEPDECENINTFEDTTENTRKKKKKNKNKSTDLESVQYEHTTDVVDGTKSKKKKRKKDEGLS